MKVANKKGNKKYFVIGLLGLIFSLFFLCLLLLPFMPGFLSLPSLWALGIWTVIGVIISQKERVECETSGIHCSEDIQ